MVEEAKGGSAVERVGRVGVKERKNLKRGREELKENQFVKSGVRKSAKSEKKRKNFKERLKCVKLYLIRSHVNYKKVESFDEKLVKKKRK